MKKIDTGEFKLLLQDATRKIENARDNLTINTFIEELVAELMDSEYASLWIFDEAEALLRRERGNDQVCEISMLDQRGILAKSFLTLSSGIYNYIASEKEYRPAVDNPDEIRMKSKIILPLIDNERLLGIVTAYSSIRHKRYFNENDMEIFETLAPFLIGVIYRMCPKKRNDAAQEVYLSDRIKEASIVAGQKVEEIHKEQRTPKAVDETLGFLANTVHDIRTPANALFGFLELLEDHIDNQRILQYVQNAKESARFINDLTTSILDQVSSNRKSANARPAKISPAKFLADIAEIFSANMSEKQIDYHIYIDPLIPKEIIIEDAKLKRVIMNLLANAYKFTPSRKSIKFSVQYDPASRVLHIAVTDTGIGIAKENQAKIFKAFEQATDDTAEKFGGTGLGLDICAQYVKAFGGELKLESELDKGSNFFFSMPLNVTNPTQTFSTCANSAAGITILLDDSNIATAKLIMRYLLRMGLPKTHVSAIRNIAQTASSTSHIIVFQHMFNDEVRKYAAQNSILVLVMEETFLSMSKDEQEQHIDVASQYSYYASNLHAMLDLRSIPKILVADDDRINIELIKAILEEKFYKVKTAKDGREALTMLENGVQNNEAFDVIFLDKHMPKFSGDELLQAFRSFEKKSGQPPIYAVSISGDPKIDTLDNALFDAYVGKPFNKKEIMKTLRKALQR